MVAKSSNPRRLNVGCGRNIREGWTNLDMAQLPGVDIVANLEQCAEDPLPLDDDSFDEFLLSHVIEHIHQPLPLMQDLWRIAKPGARLNIHVPHGANDDAWEDPTHVRPYFLSSFGYFSQPFYWRADYGYRGDWQTEKVTFVLRRTSCEGLNASQIFEKINKERNLVLEMIASLIAIKPAREPRKNLIRPPEINFQLMD